jgi:hypothetical protein
MLPNTMRKVVVNAFPRNAFPMLRRCFLISLMPSILAVERIHAADPSPSAASTSASVVGTPIQFNAGGNSERYRVSGWSKTEKEYTWSEGKSAQLGLPIPSSPGALTLLAKMGALVSRPTVPYQKVEVFANGQKIADWEVADTVDFSALIPAKVTKNESILNIEFRVPNATSPKALGLGDDGRVLGIRVYSLELKRP